MFIIIRMEDDAVFNQIAAHEALHAVIYTLDRMGVKMDVDNHEPYTYLLGDIMQNISELKLKYDKAKRKIKKKR